MSFRKGTPPHYSDWRIWVWLPARTAAGLPKLNFQDLKHSGGTALLDEGVNIKTALGWIGCANPRTTLAVYPPNRRSRRIETPLTGSSIVFRPRDGRGMIAAPTRPQPDVHEP